MTNNMTLFIVGVVTGIIIALVFVFFMSPGIMLRENKSMYSFETSLEKFEKAVIDGGWKIPAKHNLRETLLKFGKEDVKNVLVFEICSPDLAEKILKTDNERIVSNLMPCRVAFYEKNDGNVYYSRMNAGLISKAMGKVTRQQMKRAFIETEAFLKVVEE
jgi:uncharacterized protein (DUF302 family)